MSLQGLQRRALCLVGAFLSASASAATVTTTNFVVEAPTREFATAVADRAERQRESLAQVLTGNDLPAVRVRTLIRVNLSPAATDCRARTVPADAGTASLMLLTGPVDEVLGPSLDHEVLHTTLAEAVGAKFPVWLNEGLACRLDNSRLKAMRERECRDMATERTWPELDLLFAEPIRSAKQYAAAESVTDFLLIKAKPHDLVAFGVDCERLGTETALRRHFGYSSVADLDRAWRRHVTMQVTQLAAEPRATTQR